MKPIKDRDELLHILENENPNWQKEIYEKTGVILMFANYGAVLFSNCGYLDFDCDTACYYRSGTDETAIASLVECIKSMESYAEYLVDFSYGKFTKSELFWGIYERILLPIENQTLPDGTIETLWGLYKIGRYEEQVWLDMALIASDEINFEIDITKETTLHEALDSIAMTMTEITEIPGFCLKNVEKEYEVPRTYNELLNQTMPGGKFEWLRSRFLP